jgi:hypothetical protein
VFFKKVHGCGSWRKIKKNPRDRPALLLNAQGLIILN